MYIKNAAEVRQCIGQKVYWDDVGSRYIFLRSGILDGYEKRNVFINGDYKIFSSYPGLRNFEMGGAWKRNKELTS